MTGITGSGTTVWLPSIGAGDPPPPRPPFGVGIRTQGHKMTEPTSIPIQRTLKLLNPPTWYNWDSVAIPGRVAAATNQPALASLPGFWPHSWNPPSPRVDGKQVDMACTHFRPAVSAHGSDRTWLVGNEPVHAEPPYVAWCPPARMAEHCIQVSRYHGIQVAPFGGIATQQADYDYGDDLRRRLLAAGVRPAAWHWHIYPESVDRWEHYLDRVLAWAAGTPVVISETNFWAGTVDDNRRLMDIIMASLERYANILLAVFWYVSWEPANPSLPNAWQLLDSNSPNCGLTAIGAHYVECVRGT